jgi:ATP-dependent exoDNAse (exonuclease V) beta subunit
LQSGSLRFADVTHQLSAAVERVHDPFPEIRHVLLDEFQDTSVEQWQILEVLAQRCSVTEDHSFFCVGDPKQAIYGWRGGSSALLHHLGVQLPGLAERQLTRSHRFSPVISDLVNRVFGGLSDSIVFVDKDAASEAARRWQRGFTTHHAVHADRPGYARLMVALPTDEEEDRATATLRHAAGEVASLRRESPGATIGVLVRDNDAVARLLFELEAMGVSASEEGGNPLSRSPAVALVLSFLEWLDHPGSSASLFHVVESPWGTSLCLQEGASIADQDRVADRWRRLFSEQGITATLLSLTAELMTHVDSTERRALDQLIRLAQRYSPRDSGRLSDFVRHVEGTKVDSPSSSVVRVMTVHQSKGLEFDIVVLPQLDKLLVGQTPPVVFGRESASGPIRAICCYANESIRAVLPASIQKIFEESREAEYEEALCLLYVAMTRAIHAVHMIIAPAKENERTIPTTFAGVLRSALAPNMPALPGAVLFELGRRQAFAAKVVEEQAAGEGKEIG